MHECYDYFGGAPMHVREWIKCAAFAAILLADNCSVQAEDWPTFAKSTSRNGYNANETTLSAQNVPGLIQSWRTALNGPLLIQPLMLSGVTNVPGASGPTDLIYAADLTGLVVALNAQSGAV